MPGSRAKISWADTVVSRRLLRKMARTLSVEYKMYFKVNFETVVRGHHVYKSVWTPVMDQELECAHHTRDEAKEHDVNAIGVYLVNKQLEDKKTLVGHVPIELSRLLKNFLDANSENKLFAQVTGKRRREVGLVVPVKYTALTTKLRIAKILERELSERALKYTHFELKNIVINESKFPKLA